MNGVGTVTHVRLYGPSGNMSEGGSSALGDPGSSSHDDVDGWISGADIVDGWAKLSIFRLRLTVDKGDYCVTTTNSSHLSALPMAYALSTFPHTL